jgi:hypothetical protein
MYFPIQDTNRCWDCPFITNNTFQVLCETKILGMGKAMGDDGGFQGNDRQAYFEGVGYVWQDV